MNFISMRSYIDENVISMRIGIEGGIHWFCNDFGVQEGGFVGKPLVS